MCLFGLAKEKEIITVNTHSESFSRYTSLVDTKNGNVAFNKRTLNFLCQLVFAYTSLAVLTGRVLIHEVKWIINM